MLDLIKVRKELHQIPELAYKEIKTQEYILGKLKAYPGLKIHRFKPTGILVDYQGGKGKYLLFRADMDALPISENTDCDFKSLHSGMMHACGHDIHMTILLGLIDQVIKDQPAKIWYFYFNQQKKLNKEL